MCKLSKSLRACRCLTQLRGVGAGASASVGAEYVSRTVQGAALELQSSAHSETIYDSLHLKTYVRLHHEQWCIYVREVLAHDIPPKDVVLVTGWIKTSADWRTTMFRSSNTKYHTQLGGRAGGVAGVDVHYETAKSFSGSGLCRYGEAYSSHSHPLASHSATKGEPHHCVFAKRMGIKWRLGLIPELRAEAGPYEPPSQREGRSGGFGGGIEVDDRGITAEERDEDFQFSEQEVRWI